MQCEQVIVLILAEEQFAGDQQFQPDQQRHDATCQERQQDGDEIHDTDALVIERERPRLPACGAGEIVGFPVTVDVSRRCMKMIV